MAFLYGCLQFFLEYQQEYCKEAKRLSEGACSNAVGRDVGLLLLLSLVPYNALGDSVPYAA